MYRYLIFICLSLSILSCCKDKYKGNTPVNLSGKIKKIYEVDSFQNQTYRYAFTFLYDSLNGLLKTVLLDSQTYVTLDYATPNKIQLKYNRSLIGLSPGMATINAYLDNNKYIRKLTLTDSLNPIETENLLIYNNANHLPDSIREYTFPSFYDYSYYTDFTFSNSSITSFIHRYSSYFTGDRIDSIKNYYSNYNYQKLPLQTNQLGAYGAGYSTSASSVLFLLSLSDIYNSNNHTYIYNSYTINSTYIANYAYIFDTLNRVTNENITTEDYTLSFRIEYY